jgi:hypothetical protein
MPEPVVGSVVGDVEVRELETRAADEGVVRDHYFGTGDAGFWRGGGQWREQCLRGSAESRPHFLPVGPGRSRSLRAPR